MQPQGKIHTYAYIYIFIWPNEYLIQASERNASSKTPPELK